MSEDWSRQSGSFAHNGVEYDIYNDGSGGTVYLQAGLGVMIATGAL